MAKTQDAALAELADLGKSLGEIVDDQEKKKEILNGILATIGSLDKDDAKALFKNEKVQRLIELASSEMVDSSTLPPGSYMPGPMGMKVAWTESHLNKLIADGKMELVRNYRPVSTPHGPIVWNGLVRYFRARQPITVPQCFVDVYEAHLDAEMLAEQHAEWLFRKGDYLRDRSVLTEGGVRVRGTGGVGQGHYVPGGGLVDMSDREG